MQCKAYHILGLSLSLRVGDCRAIMFQHCILHVHEQHPARFQICAGRPGASGVLYLERFHASSMPSWRTLPSISFTDVLSLFLRARLARVTWLQFHLRRTQPIEIARVPAKLPYGVKFHCVQIFDMDYLHTWRFNGLIISSISVVCSWHLCIW